MTFNQFAKTELPGQFFFMASADPRPYRMVGIYLCTINSKNAKDSLVPGSHQPSVIGYFKLPFGAFKPLKPPDSDRSK